MLRRPLCTGCTKVIYCMQPYCKSYYSHSQHAVYRSCGNRYGHDVCAFLQLLCDLRSHLSFRKRPALHEARRAHYFRILHLDDPHMHHPHQPQEDQAGRAQIRRLHNYRRLQIKYCRCIILRNHNYRHHSNCHTPHVLYIQDQRHYASERLLHIL